MLKKGGDDIDYRWYRFHVCLKISLFCLSIQIVIFIYRHKFEGFLLQNVKICFFPFHLTSWSWWEVWCQFYFPFFFLRDHMLFVFKTILELPSYSYVFFNMNLNSRYLYISIFSIYIFLYILCLWYFLSIWRFESFFSLGKCSSIFLPFCLPFFVPSSFPSFFPSF